MSTPDDRIADTLKLGKPAQRALDAAGIVTFADLSGWTRKDVAGLHGVGARLFVTLEPAMAERGVAFRP